MINIITDHKIRDMCVRKVSCKRLNHSIQVCIQFDDGGFVIINSSEREVIWKK